MTHSAGTSLTSNLLTLCLPGLLLLLAGCGADSGDPVADGGLEIAGELTFELESGSREVTADITLARDGTAAPVAKVSLPLRGQSGSEPFSLAVERQRLAADTDYHLHVEVQAGGQTVATADPRALNVSADSVDVGVINVVETAAATASAPLPGTFTARGNEPGWHLEIGPQTLELVAYYGETRVTGPAPQAETAGEATVYAMTTEDQDLSVTVHAVYCSDTMTGLPYPSTVVVVLNGDTLNGCGGDPQALLADTEWTVSSVDGRTVEQAHITLGFAADGTVSGNGGCNGYSGRYALDAEGLVISELNRTQMACDPGVDAEEQEYLDVLDNVHHFHLDENGVLGLETDGGRTITAHRG